MIDKEGFHKLCDEFQESVEESDSDIFHPSEDTVLTLGNGQWVVHLCCSDETLEDPKWPLVLLFRTRRDLVLPILTVRNFWGFTKAAYELAEWMQERGYAVSVEGKGFFNTAKLFMFDVLTRVLSWFVPANQKG